MSAVPAGAGPPLAPPAPRPAPGAPRHGISRSLFLATLVMWLVIPVLIRANLGQDALPYVVAGQLVRDQPGEVYASQNGDLYGLRPAFADRSCALAPPGTDCVNLSVGFVSLPQALPFAFGLAQVGGDTGVLLLRLAAAGCLAGGMFMLWTRLAGSSRRAPAVLALTALLLTPFVMVPVSLGQTSPILFLSTVLGVSGTGRAGQPRRLRPVLVTAGVWVAAIALKGFPGVLAIVLVRQRRWALLAAAAGWSAALTAAALWLAPVSIVSDFVRSSLLLNEATAANPYNGSANVVLTRLAPPLAHGALSSVVLFARFVAAIGLWWWAGRDAEDDDQWAYAWLVVLLVVPLLWWHYLWIAVGALGVLIASRDDPDRWLPLLPITAAVFVPLAILNGRGSSASVAQSIALFAVVGLGAWLLRRPARRACVGASC